MGEHVHKRLLELAGFEHDEMHEYLPQWLEASVQLGLHEDDVAFAVEEWIPAHFDVTLRGVRKMIGAYMRETIDLTKANAYKQNGVKIVYGLVPAHSTFWLALKLTAPDKVFVSFPDMFLVSILNPFFHKLNPYLEGAEKEGIPYGCRHCALNKTRYWARKLDVIPSPDISWIFGFICDESTKTDEFIQDFCDPGWKTFVTRIPHDQPLGTEEDEIDERVEYLAQQLKVGFEAVQKAIGIHVPDEKVKEAADILWTRYAPKVAELYRLMASDPQPLSGEDAYFMAQAYTFPFNTGIEHMESALDILIDEVKERVANHQGILPKGAPKLSVYFTPFGNPWILKMFEENGVGVPFCDLMMPSKKMLQPSRFDDPYMAAAESWLKYPLSVNAGYKCKIICEKIETYGADGMLFGFFDFDRWLGSDQRLISKMIEERLDLPVFYIEGDIFEDRDYSPEALRTRIETIASIVKMRKS